MQEKAKKKQKKFYRPGKLEHKGTKISIKTQPYINGVIFDLNDPITHFHSYLSTLALLINQYEILSAIPNVQAFTHVEPIDLETCTRLKTLLQFLTLSPTEIVLKDQFVDKEVLDMIKIGETYERQR
jgi:hypothetical protein